MTTCMWCGELKSKHCPGDDGWLQRDTGNATWTPPPYCWQPTHYFLMKMGEYQCPISHTRPQEFATQQHLPHNNIYHTATLLSSKCLRIPGFAITGIRAKKLPLSLQAFSEVQKQLLARLPQTARSLIGQAVSETTCSSQLLFVERAVVWGAVVFVP